MAQSKSKTSSTETAYAEAAAAVPVKKPVKAPARKPAVKAAAAKVVAPKVAAPKPAKPAASAAPAVKDAPAVATAPVIEPIAVIEAAPLPETAPTLEVAAAIEATPVIETTPATEPALAPKNPLISLKDITMTTDFTANITETMSEAATEVQAKFQAAFDKSSAMVTEMTDLAKGNVEALVESTKLFAAGVQDLGKSYADEAKSAYETATADMKEMASIKSPTELFQLQGKILRRNFDAMVAATSKSTDAALKLANDAMAPISGRVNVTAEKLSQVAA